MSHTGLVSLPVPVVGQQNSTLLHVPVVPLVLVSRARVVVGTGFPLLFHFSYHYYSPGCSHPGSSMRDIATLSAPQNPRGVDGQILTPWKLSHARRARHVPMPIGHSFAGLPPHSRRHNPQKWLVPLYRITTCACRSARCRHDRCRYSSARHHRSLISVSNRQNLAPRGEPRALRAIPA